MHYLLFAGYYEDENHDDLYAVDQQFLRSWANLINVVSIIITIKYIARMHVHIHNTEISKGQNDIIKIYLCILSKYR